MSNTKNNLTALLEKWQPGGDEEKKEQRPAAAAGTPNLSAAQHFDGEEAKHPASRPADSKPAADPGSQNSFDLNDDEIMEFFNRVESNVETPQAPAPAAPPAAVPVPVAPAAQDMFRPASLIKAAKEDPASVHKPVENELRFDDDMLDVEDEKADCVFVGGVEEVPDKSTGDILQRLDEITGKPQEAKSESKDWARVFPWEQEVLQTNKLVFGHETFRENQREIINAAKSKMDVLGLVPTGSGKSLTYQICAATDEGVTFVVMPLLSLIVDQVSYLNFVGVGNVFFKSGMDVDALRNQLIQGATKVVFLTPEKLAQAQTLINLLSELYSTHRIARFVIDEAHCISQWGKEFRPDYLHLSALRDRFPEVPMLALTATATLVVKEDICTRLKMRSPVIVQGKFNRENLFYEVRAKSRVMNVVSDMGGFIKKEHLNDSGIVYCNTKRECEDLAKVLRTNFRLSCEFYHAGIEEEEKKAIQQRWMDGKVKTIIATTAFGLGINKANVRYIIHYSMPRSMEHYVQECGRAGRDGLPSHCLMYYDLSDKRTHEYLLLQGRDQHESAAVMQYAQANLFKILDYCEEQFVCRRRIQLEYFGETYSPQDCKDMCDNCKLRKARGAAQSFQKEAGLALDFVREVIQRKRFITLLQVADYLHGRNKKKLESVETPNMAKSYGALKQMSLPRIKTILLKLLVNRVLKEDIYQGKQNVTTYLGVGRGEKDFLENKLVIRLMVAKEEAAHKKEPGKAEQAAGGERVRPAPSRVYYAAKSKGEAVPAGGARFVLAPRANLGPGRQAPKTHSELKARLKDQDVEDILDRLIYVKNRLMLRNKDDDKLISELFSVQTLMVISHTVPSDLPELRLLVETRKWTPEEDRVFVKYGTYFVREINHYLYTYVPGGEGAEEGQGAEQRAPVEYSLKDYEAFADIAGEGFDEERDEGEEGKRRFGEVFRAPADKGKRFKKPDEFL